LCRKGKEHRKRGQPLGTSPNEKRIPHLKTKKKEGAKEIPKKEFVRGGREKAELLH